MTSPCWTLDEYNARLTLKSLDAELDLLRPARGLADVHLAGSRLEGASLLGIEMPSYCPGSINRMGADRLVERYVRGRELVGAYKESEAWPVRVDVMWRAVGPKKGSGLICAKHPPGRPGKLNLVPFLDVVVSVSTQQLDSHPALAVRSLVPTVGGKKGPGLICAKHPPGRPGKLNLGGKKGPGLICAEHLSGRPGKLNLVPFSPLIFRLPGCDFSYVEMIDPANFGHDEVVEDEGSQAVLCVRHHLFPAPLEKGVILRARVRGMFVPRDGDMQIAVECYEDFMAAEPPLAD